jgi:hypothetical protein
VDSAKEAGFFYDVLKPKDPSKNEQWRQIEQLWIVTNRHVLLPRFGTQETIPDSVTFRIRRLEGDRIVWEPIILDRDEFRARARLHPSPRVDVAAIHVMDLISARVREANTRYMNWYAVDAEHLPGNNNISVEVADDAVVIGYPRGFYDEHNVFPVVKAGIIASRWGAGFNGEPYFLIDAKLFPGSSGSIVISKPRDLAIVDGHLMMAKEKQFAFLGIFSGEPLVQHDPLEFEDMTIIRRSGFNVGVVWYGYLVNEVIAGGVEIPS